MRCVLHTCTDTTHISSDTHLFTASYLCYPPHAGPFSFPLPRCTISIEKGRTKYFPVPGKWKVHRADLFYGPLKYPMVIWCYFFIPSRCLRFLFFNSFLVFQHLSTIGQDWTKTNSSEACLCLPGRTDKDEHVRRVWRQRESGLCFFFFFLTRQMNESWVVFDSHPICDSSLMFDRDVNSSSQTLQNLQRRDSHSVQRGWVSVSLSACCLSLSWMLKAN